MSASGIRAGHAELMDGVYRRQRHVYDLTRKYYLLGRDRMIGGLAVPAGGTVLELGCGTGRNMVLAARRYPAARLFGIDISGEMLETAATSVARHGIAGRAALARGDATDFDAAALFGVSTGLMALAPTYGVYALLTIPAGFFAITLAVALSIGAAGASTLLSRRRYGFWMLAGAFAFAALLQLLGAFRIELAVAGLVNIGIIGWLLRPVWTKLD